MPNFQRPFGRQGGGMRPPQSMNGYRFSGPAQAGQGGLAGRMGAQNPQSPAFGGGLGANRPGMQNPFLQPPQGGAPMGPGYGAYGQQFNPMQVNRNLGQMMGGAPYLDRSGNPPPPATGQTPVGPGYRPPPPGRNPATRGGGTGARGNNFEGDPNYNNGPVGPGNTGGPPSGPEEQGGPPVSGN